MCRSLQNLIITHYRDKNTVQAIVFVEALFLYIILSPNLQRIFLAREILTKFSLPSPYNLTSFFQRSIIRFPKVGSCFSSGLYFKRGFEKYCSGHIFKQAQVTVVNYLFVLISFIKGTYLNLSRFSVLC